MRAARADGRLLNLRNPAAIPGLRAGRSVASSRSRAMKSAAAIQRHGRRAE